MEKLGISATCEDDTTFISSVMLQVIRTSKVPK